MTILDVAKIDGTRYPAGRVTRPLVGGSSPLGDNDFKFGYVVLDPEGGQVPWHSHEPEEVYFVIEGRGEICVGAERAEIRGGQMVHLPPGIFHQLTNVGRTPLVMLYCCGRGITLHGKQELSGGLPAAGRDAPELPAGARPQRASGPRS